MRSFFLRRHYTQGGGGASGPVLVVFCLSLKCPAEGVRAFADTPAGRGASMSGQFSRRAFLGGSGAVAGSAMLRAGMPALAAISASACKARDEGAEFAVLSPGEALDFEAIAARIIPATDTPGAREAGVVWFFDKGFGSFMQSALEPARAGLLELNAEAAARYPGHRRFAELDDDRQDELLAAREESPFFGMMHFLTVAGFFGMSSYGGNRGQVGWKLLGLDGGHAWQPPFGWYDAQEVEGDRRDS